MKVIVQHPVHQNNSLRGFLYLNLHTCIYMLLLFLVDQCQRTQFSLIHLWWPKCASDIALIALGIAVAVSKITYSSIGILAIEVSKNLKDKHVG